MHADSCFLTLTYDDDKLPSDGSLNKRHLQLFMKKVRKKYGSGIRFYACGEYGDNTQRPHYHVLLFGFDFPDKRFYKYNGREDRLYTSASLEKLWSFGLCVIGDVTFDSAAYVARYIVKKITGDAAEQHYMRRAVDGSLYQLAPEFVNMSRRPGIGYEAYRKFAHQWYARGLVVFNGVECAPPRFYDDKYSMVDSMLVADLKVLRRRNALKHRLNNTVDRRRVREVVALAKLNQLRRSV